MLCAVLLLVAGCRADKRAAFNFGLASAPVTLDPRYATDAVSNRLCRRDQPLTAVDVVVTYRSVLHAGQASPHRTSLANIKDLRIVAKRTVEFDLFEPDLLFPGMLVIGILPADVASADSPPDLSRTSGAFRLVDWDTRGNLWLQRKRDGAMFRFAAIADATVRALKLLSGEFDIIHGDIPPEIVSWLEARDGITVQHVRGNTFSYLGFNLRDDLSWRPALREAIAHAIDRDAIITHLFHGRARIANAILPPEHWAGSGALIGLPYDPELAVRLVAGTATDVPHIVYKASSNHFRLRLATILQSQLAAVGIDMEIRSYDWGTFYGDIKSGRFQMYGLSWVGLQLPEIFRYAFHSDSFPPAGANRGRYRSTVVDTLIERAERARSRAQRAAAYAEIQQQLLYDLPYIPLWYEDQLIAMRADVSGYTMDSSGNFDALSLVERTLHAASL